MEGKSSSKPNRKRPLSEDNDSDSNKPPMQKKPRFPKGKKVKGGIENVVVINGPAEAPGTELPDAKIAANERINRRRQMTTELYNEDSAAEISYKDDANLMEDGIQIEPFNLDKEREEGYFDENLNFVEYVDNNELKDAWLDSVDIDTRFAEKKFNVVKEDETKELSSEDIGVIKRRIANLLEPGETVLQALRRLKGTSNGKKEKMGEETKCMFDQLTEDSMKLMDNGDYDVYHDKKEAFEREAEGYERLARAREADAFDMFGDDDTPAPNPSSNEAGLTAAQPSSESINMNPEGGDSQTDYVYDAASGYYYSSSLGYYYDPTSGLYCSATSGKWYSFNEQAGTYEEVQGESAATVS